MTEKPIYPCLAVSIPAKLKEEIEIELEDLGANALEERDDTTMLGAEQGTVELIAGFENSMSRDLAVKSLTEKNGSWLLVNKVDVLGDDWSRGWQEYFKPVILRLIQIITPWMKPPRDDLITITIDPGQAFGTGGHATTITILKFLEKQSLNKGGLPNRILDLGTGSGVLAIAAAKLGATSVTAIDIEEEAVFAAIDNSISNGVEDSIQALRAEPFELEGQWPLVLANLEMKIFQEHAADIVKRVEALGTIYVSGLLIEQIDVFFSLFKGFELIDRQDEDEWTGLEMRRTS